MWNVPSYAHSQNICPDARMADIVYEEVPGI